MTTQNLWDAPKAFLRGKVIAIQSYLKKQEKYQIDSLTLHLKQFEEEEQKTCKISKRKEIIKIRAEINEKEMKETIVKIKKLKAGSLRRQKKWQTFSQTHPEKERRIKSTKLEMKKERLQQTIQKYKGL